MNIKFVIPTTEGDFIAHYSEHGLARLDFPHAADSERREKSTRAHENDLPLLGERDGVRADVTTSSQISRWHRLTTEALTDALAGRAPRGLPPLDLSAGTEFQRRVWSALRRIASGRTRSYGEVAAEIGSPRATRAVGGACGANPIPVLVPCHRVLAANDAIGGFGGGLNWKRKLLAREGIAVD